MQAIFAAFSLYFEIFPIKILIFPKVIRLLLRIFDLLLPIIYFAKFILRGIFLIIKFSVNIHLDLTIAHSNFKEYYLVVYFRLRAFSFRFKAH